MEDDAKQQDDDVASEEKETDVEMGETKEDRPVDDSLPAPTLYDECRQAFLAGYLIFGVVDLRNKARQELNAKGNENEVSVSTLQRIMTLPCPFDQVLPLLKEDQKDEPPSNDARLYEQGAQYYIETDTELVVMNDHHQEEEVTYMITVSHRLKQVTVVFRGSTTVKDWMQDAKLILASIPNPVLKTTTNTSKDNEPEQAEQLGVHLGFREYLYKEVDWTKVLYVPNKRKDDSQENVDTTQAEETNQPKGDRPRMQKHSTPTRDRDDLQPLKYEVILEQVLDYLKPTEDEDAYSLFITGHSLGASLATLFAFQAAADPSIIAASTTVTCVTSGAVKVGNLDFLRAFESLERAGRLRCVQVSNNRDVIPKMPINGAPINCFGAICCQARTFRHVGLQLAFRDRGRYVVTFPPPASVGPWGLMWYDVVSTVMFWGLLLILVLPFLSCIYAISCLLPLALFIKYGTDCDKHHSVHKYMARLENCKKDLKTQRIDDLNEQRWTKEVSCWRGRLYRSP